MLVQHILYQIFVEWKLNVVVFMIRRTITKIDSYASKFAAIHYRYLLTWLFYYQVQCRSAGINPGYHAIPHSSSREQARLYNRSVMLNKCTAKRLQLRLIIVYLSYWCIGYGISNIFLYHSARIIGKFVNLKQIYKYDDSGDYPIIVIKALSAFHFSMYLPLAVIKNYYKFDKCKDSNSQKVEIMTKIEKHSLFSQILMILIVIILNQCGVNFIINCMIAYLAEGWILSVSYECIPDPVDKFKVLKRKQSVLKVQSKSIQTGLQMNLFCEPLFIAQLLLQYLGSNNMIVSIIIWQYLFYFDDKKEKWSKDSYNQLKKCFATVSGDTIIVLTKKPLFQSKGNSAEFTKSKAFDNVLNLLLRILTDDHDSIIEDEIKFVMVSHQTSYIIKFNRCFKLGKYQLIQLERLFIHLQRILIYYQQDIILVENNDGSFKQNICLNLANFDNIQSIEMLVQKQNLKLRDICQIVWSSYKRKKCHVCHKRACGMKPLKLCKRCQKIYYCSKKCQKKDWKFGRHYQVCC